MQIDLSNFELKDTLNPSIWEESDGSYILRPGVREKLMKMSLKFWDSLGFEPDDLEDIYLVGSSCNFNWSDVSDLDVHLEADFSQIDDNHDIIDGFFRTKSREWNKAHQGLHIGNTPVEMFVQDVGTLLGSEVKFSLLHNEWITEPTKEALGELTDDDLIIKKSLLLMAIIDGIEKAFRRAETKEEYATIYDDINAFLGKITGVRRKGLRRGGEMDRDNIVYKILRRSGHLEKVWNLSDEIFDKVYSQDYEEEYI